MEIKFYRPRNLLLQNYIENFYYLTLLPDEEPVVYVAFPSTFYFVTVNENALSITQKEYKSFIHRPGERPVSELIFNFEKPHFIEYRGGASELNICFKPLGINAFLKISSPVIAQITQHHFILSRIIKSISEKFVP